MGGMNCDDLQPFVVALRGNTLEGFSVVMPVGVVLAIDAHAAFCQAMQRWPESLVLCAVRWEDTPVAVRLAAIIQDC